MPVVLISAPVFFGIIYVSRYVSLGSLLGTAFGALVSVAFVALGWLDAGWLAYSVCATAIVWIAHSDNIARLRSGTERRLGSPPP